jgi:hypothetical protein
MNDITYFAHIFTLVLFILLSEKAGFSEYVNLFGFLLKIFTKGPLV